MLRVVELAARAMLLAGSGLRRWSVGPRKPIDRERPLFQLTLLKVDVVLPGDGQVTGKRRP